MAHAFRRPLFSSLGAPSSISHRCFSQIAPRCGPPQGSQMQGARPHQPAERSLRVAAKNVRQMPSDVGLLDMTFVTPTGANVPSLFQNPRSLLKFQLKRFRYSFRDFFSLLILKWSSPAEKRWFNRAIKLNRSTITPTAVALHKQMYTAFAEGDAATLRKICTDGIYESFRARIANRPRGEKWQWELVGYNKRAKVVSSRAARLPIEGAAVRQSVVRICSQQRLTRSRRKKGSQEWEVVPGTGSVRDVVEYVVVQKRADDWVEGDWQVWGTTSETTLEDVAAWERRLLE